jgi:hypothetical protein
MSIGSTNRTNCIDVKYILLRTSSFLVYFYSLPPLLYGTAFTMEKQVTADLRSQSSNNRSTDGYTTT